MSALPVELFRRITTGVYVVTASQDGATGGFTVAWVSQVSFDPLLLALSVNPDNATWPIIQRSRRFVLNVLKGGQYELARHFGTKSGRDEDKIAQVGTTTAAGGALLLSQAAAWVDCRLEHHVTAGDHVVVIARAVGGDVLDPRATPLRYSETGNMDGSADLYPHAFPDVG
jgi:flavin reductase (DIM6/NTAB) family NADH-FMN oxidoreductase RutF